MNRHDMEYKRAMARLRKIFRPELVKDLMAEGDVTPDDVADHLSRLEPVMGRVEAIKRTAIFVRAFR